MEDAEYIENLINKIIIKLSEEDIEKLINYIVVCKSRKSN